MFIRDCRWPIALAMTLILIFIALLIYFNLPISKKSLNEVSSWCYQLQGKKDTLLKIEALEQLSCDLLVTDYSATGEEKNEWTRSDIKRLKVNGRIVLSYLSIGEAESVRFYFRTLDKKLIHAENQDWKGNFKVYFWQAEWQETIFHYIDRIINQGFDGVYLDIIDAYFYFGLKENGGLGIRREAAQDMIEFVDKIARHARFTRNKKDFLVFVQNASAITQAESFPKGLSLEGQKLMQTSVPPRTVLKNRYFNSINAIGVEDVFFRGREKNNNPYNPDPFVLKYLEEFKKHGKPIFSIEYIQDEILINQYFKVAQEKGFIPLAVERSLDGSFLRSE